MAQICTSCNFSQNPERRKTCLVCGSDLGPPTPGEPLETPSRRASYSCEPSIVFSPPSAINPPPPAASTSALAPGRVEAPPRPIAEPTSHPHCPPSLEGMVTRIESHTEPATPDRYQFLTQLILFLVFLPLLLSAFAILSGLWLAFSLIGLRGLARGFSPGNFVAFLNSTTIAGAIFFGRSTQNTQDRVQNIRVQSHGDGQNRGAVIRGELTGDIHTGDDVVLNGVWREGTLMVRSGVNRTLNCALSLRRNPWKGRFFSLLFVILCLSGVLAFFAMGRLP